MSDNLAPWCGANYAEGGCTWTGGCDGDWKAEIDWTERAEEAVKQQGLLSRLKNLQWLGKSTDSKPEEGPRLRAWSWSKARTSPSPTLATGPDPDSSRGPRSFLPFRRLRASQDQPRAPELDMLEIPQEWRISQNWVVLPRDSDPEDPTAFSTLTPPSNIRRNRRSAPPIIISGPSQHGHAHAVSVDGWEVPAHRMKPLPPLPPAHDSQDHEHR
ncbi:hypothetical protein FRC04_009802 [Tulasnella sp. 424]|nr:hypothetical protein FRC04_009802 [Tulasnella sp. 424]